LSLAIWRPSLWFPPSLCGFDPLAMFTAGKQQRKSTGKAQHKTDGKIAHNGATNTTCCCTPTFPCPSCNGTIPSGYVASLTGWTGVSCGIIDTASTFRAKSTGNINQTYNPVAFSNCIWKTALLALPFGFAFSVYNSTDTTCVTALSHAVNIYAKVDATVHGFFVYAVMNDASEWPLYTAGLPISWQDNSHVNNCNTTITFGSNQEKSSGVTWGGGVSMVPA
jgi:hypothetical protein